jgi:hypothetical protein
MCSDSTTDIRHVTHHVWVTGLGNTVLPSWLRLMALALEQFGPLLPESRFHHGTPPGACALDCWVWKPRCLWLWSPLVRGWVAAVCGDWWQASNLASRVPWRTAPKTQGFLGAPLKFPCPMRKKSGELQPPESMQATEGSDSPGVG